MKNNLTPFFLLFFAMLFSACNFNSSERLQNRTFENLPQNFEVKHKVIFENKTPNILIQVPAFQYFLTLKVFITNEKKKELIWTSEKEINDSISECLHKFKLDCNESDFVLEVNVFSTNRQLLYSDLSLVNNKNGQNTIYLLDENENYLIDDNVKIDTKYRIISTEQSDCNISYFSSGLSPAPPPYSQNEGFFNPKEAEVTEKLELKNRDFFQFNRTGTYYIYTNDNQENGVFVSVFHKDFPIISQLKDLILATRFITKNEEYKKLLNAENPKTVLDEFWLSRNKNESEAKQLIKTYYNRAKEANRLFSYAKEGWKTDMGMIFIIFGRPAMVKKFSNKIIWYYSQSAGRGPVEFVFENRFGQAVLERSENYRDAWNAEILKWRMGKLE